jgi:hypothetical protein
LGLADGGRRAFGHIPMARKSVVGLLRRNQMLPRGANVVLGKPPFWVITRCGHERVGKSPHPNDPLHPGPDRTVAASDSCPEEYDPCEGDELGTPHHLRSQQAGAPAAGARRDSLTLSRSGSLRRPPSRRRASYAFPPRRTHPYVLNAARILPTLTRVIVR